MLKALRRNALCVFMSRKVKTVLNEGGGGAAILAGKSWDNAPPSCFCWEWRFHERWPSWYFCMLVYIPLYQSFCSKRLVDPKALCFGCCPQDRFWCFEYKILPLRKKSLSCEGGAPKVFVCHCNSFRSGFWLKLFCNHFFSLCKVIKKSVYECECVWLCKK